MDTESNGRELFNPSEFIPDDSVDFSRVSAIASRWMFDFSFLSLCRHFREGGLDRFTTTRRTFEAISQGFRLRREQVQKQKIAAFLGGVLCGQQLDVVCEKENKVTPLMSAINVWETLKETVPDQTLHSSVSTLLYVQSVGVFLEKGQTAMASTALMWLEEKHCIPKNLSVKLSTLVARGDTYHPFMRNFSYQHLLEKVREFLDTFLAGKPPDFLLQKWTYDMDQCLRRGVWKHGEGNWRLMLLDYNFRGRTGTMLKDRWRILKRDFQAR
ncbi:hypothetical protein NHX12_021447 [Muraenolepis orangiensis]|uniref:Uncharacterized protein n=1 Tax=Muraenolepis orangiensis TaxID=630683 RepID=A0A9Q0EVI3_9TELE|nr:hypothetical protein NHX12_021447 [Muraenolepis orangiensis]